MDLSYKNGRGTRQVHFEHAINHNQTKKPREMASVMSSQQYPVFSSDHVPGGANSNVFRVKNIDDRGRIIHMGYLEVLPGELVFRYEHHPQHETRWPLHTIRRYGINLESNVFAFEAGRRAPEGEGSFAFRTEGVQACEIRQRLDYFTHSS